MCSVGETCVIGAPASAGSTLVHFCRPDRFRVDLNLLDLCIRHYLDHSSPVFTGAKCSLERNLNRLLDQNGDARFNLFDLDLCVLAFIEQRGCVRDAAGVLVAVEDAVTCCENDAACGRGSYCDEKLHICQRDCGTIASREDTFGSLERQCMAARTTCDESRGKCREVDVTQQTCQVDGDCLTGSYCLLGRCAPYCYRAIDCPDSGWYCTKNNQCRALPPAEANEGFSFEPANYAIRFARDGLGLNAIQTFDSSPLAIMDLITKRQVIGNASIAFGYRMEITYGLKTDAKCQKPFVDCSTSDKPPDETEIECTARQDDCLIDVSEQWIRPLTPFGMVSAAGVPRIGIQLEESIADRLTPGEYPAVVRLIFDNGDSDQVPVRFVKASPSGEYNGSLTVYQGIVENALNGNRPFTYGMRIKVYPKETRQWNELMASHQLDTDDEGFVDQTVGQLVHASIHGRTALAFTRGGAGTSVPDEVQMVGLYTPDTGRMRLIGVIDIPANFQIDADGGSCPPGSKALCAKNLFGRNIRRRIEFIGPFEDATQRFHGIYRETIFGLVPGDGLTLEGGFIMDQTAADDTDLEVDAPIGKTSSTFTFSEVTTVSTAVCSSYTSSSDAAKYDPKLQGAIDDFATYIAQARRKGPPQLCSVSTDCANGGTCTEGACAETLAACFTNGDCTNAVCVANQCQPNATIFRELVEFRPTIELALAALQPNNIGGIGFDPTPSDPLDTEASDPAVIQAHLNIYDFLEEWVVPCQAGDPSPPPGCIDPAKLECGLAVHQNAFVTGAIDADAVDASGGHPVGIDPDLFCLDTLPTTGCPTVAKGTGFDYTDLFALQEHNRFWQNLAQIWKFEGDRARSDAFMVLFRNEVNPFAKGAAISFKADKLRESIVAYDRVIQEIIGRVPATILFKFPVRSFKQMGNDWLDMMNAVASDRMGALLELVDLERRVFATTTEADFRYAHHLMQQEYLIQVYIMTLQSRWQKELFAYRGEAGPVLERGAHILQKLNPAKNELGITGNQVFFENGDPSLLNWEHYRVTLVGEDGSGGMLGEARTTVGDAIDQMKNALTDLDTFEASLEESRKGYADKLDEICGNPAPTGATANGTFDATDAGNVCQALLSQFDSADDWAKIRDCKWGGNSPGAQGDNTPLTVADAVCASAVVACTQTCASCGVNECDEIVKKFTTDTNGMEPVTGEGTTATPQAPGDIINNPPRCGFEGFQANMLSIPVQGVQRPCVGGAMGEAFRERAAIDRQRRIVIGSVETLLRQTKHDLTAMKFRLGAKAADILQWAIFKIVDGALAAAASVIEDAGKISDDFTEGPKCTIIGGLAVGTDCPQKGITAAIDGLVDTGLSFAGTLVNIIKWGGEVISEELSKLAEIAIDKSDAIEGIKKDLREVDNLIDAYNGLTQDSFNVVAKIAGLRYQATAAGDRFGEEVLFTAQHLVGRESGNILRGEGMARDASEAFEGLLGYAYRMTMAFINHYNTPPGDATNLIAQVLALTTLDDVAGFVAELDKRVLEYCGLEGIDCDDKNNSEILRYSVREQLFPQLRDIVDARTGKVLTAGEQFHNIITSPPYLKRRFRGPHVVDQIEILLPLPITAKENAPGGPKWLLDPLSCNQKVGGRNTNDSSGIDLGTHAVNIVGRNLDSGGSGFHYEFLRGPTDYLRACHMESVQKEIGTLPNLEYPIRKWTVGYAPQNPNADQDAPPAYVTRSDSFRACVNLGEVNGVIEPAAPCWRFFARDRSLATLDGRMVIPLVVDDAATENHWVPGEGLPEDQRPIIEDIVIYYRYEARPVQE